MDKKGFTLVEVLGTIIILGSIALIAGRFFTKNVDETKKTISANQEASILSATEKWSIENTDLLETSSTAKNVAGSVTQALAKDEITMCVTTDYLFNEGYINTKDVKIENNEKFSGYIIISWDEKNNQYKFRLANTDKEITSCKNHLVTGK